MHIEIDNIPDGYEPLAFRFPQKGDTYINWEGRAIFAHNASHLSPKMILRKVAKPIELVHRIYDNGSSEATRLSGVTYVLSCETPFLVGTYNDLEIIKLTNNNGEEHLFLGHWNDGV